MMTVYPQRLTLIMTSLPRGLYENVVLIDLGICVVSVGVGDSLGAMSSSMYAC